MINGILLTHGNLADELLKTAGSIYGNITNCVPVSNANKSQHSLIEELDAIVSRGSPTDQYMILTDFFGGSCSHACLAVAETHENVRMVTGVNLPMLLAFLNRRNEVPFDELADVLVDRGVKSIRVLDRENL